MSVCVWIYFSIFLFEFFSMLNQPTSLVNYVAEEGNATIEIGVDKKTKK